MEDPINWDAVRAWTEHRGPRRSLKQAHEFKSPEGSLSRALEERDLYHAALLRVRDAVGEMCPAWALEWPAVREGILGSEDVEDYTAQDVRDCVAPVIEVVAAVLREVEL